MSDNPNFENGREIFYWCGQKRYRCSQKWESGAACDFDTYDFTALLEHEAQPHTRTGQAAPVAPKVSTSILGADGKPYNSVEETGFEDFRFKE